MKKKYVLIALMLLLGGIGLLIVNKQTAVSEAETNVAAETASAKNNDGALSENDIVLTHDVDLNLVDIEVEKHGYHPSTKQERDTLRKSYLIARDGADAMLTFHVVDATGQSVPDALFHAEFIFNEESFTEMNGKTDKNGMFVAKGKTSFEVNYVVQKDEYYQTSTTYKFNKQQGDDVKNGKWTQWNPMVKVTLKEKRNPIPMYAQGITIKLPEKGKSFGVDFKVGDLVKPYGMGEHADLLVMCNIEERGHFFDMKAELFVTAVHPDEGIIINTADNGSQLRSSHEAQESGYEPKYYLVEDRTAEKVLQKIEFTQTEYLTFRSRIVRDNEGEIISSHYGKITAVEYGRFNARSSDARVSFTYYFNPTPNDRNIEYDPDENLFDKRKFRGMQP